jgi:uncharacterized protein with PhoU and TrkA domain
MREDHNGPRNLKEMLSEAKNTSELMVDLAYAALFYNSEDFSEEVFRLEERLNELVYDMRTMAILAARSPADSEQMAGILQVVQDIEKIGNAAFDVAKIVIKKLGIPPELLQDLPDAEEITSRVHVQPGSPVDGRSLEELGLPVETGMRPIAVRSGSVWNFDPGPEDVLREGDVLFLQGPPEGVAEIRQLAGAVPLLGLANENATASDSEGLSELERAVDILIEMKNLSEVAMGLAYSALLYYDAGLAREVVAIEDEMDEMRYRLERWVLLAARHVEDPSRLRGLLHLATASEAIADCAQEMVWIVEKGEEVHPVQIGRAHV